VTIGRYDGDMTATAEPVSNPAAAPAAPAAHAAIADAGRQLRRARRRFLEREDPESLHDLRVAVRRLRAVLTLFRPILVLPRRLSDRDVRRVGHDLAALRDQDVALQAILAAPSDAPEVRDRLRRLERRRRREAFRVAVRLRGQRVRGMLAALRRWDRSPGFSVDEDAPASVIVTGLRSRVAAIELHPAWSLALVPDAAGVLHAPDSVYDDDTTAELLHQLRRRIKQVRYQMEVMARVLTYDWSLAVERLRVLQESLGVLQDARVLGGLVELPHDRIAAASATWDELRGERVGGVRQALDGR